MFKVNLFFRLYSISYRTFNSQMAKLIDKKINVIIFTKVQL